MNRRRILIGSASSKSVFEPIILDNYLTIVALENGLTAQLSTNACEYCINGDGNWRTLSAGTNTIFINKGQTLSFRGNLIPTETGIGTFTISKSCNLKGNCMSMLFGDDAASNTSLSGKGYAFHRLFYNCTTIKSVSSGFLPATTLASGCYRQMFFGCDSLTQVPELPATNLAYYCYGGMFYNCTRLTTAPALPATTLADNCYNYMFYGTNVLPDCSNINFSSESVVSSGGLNGLFAGTKVTDADLERILPKNSNGKYYLPATELTYNCYYEMFRGCTSLITAPELPATTLKESCYRNMFSGCTSLTTPPELPATTLAIYCYEYMFSYCSSLTIAPELPATTAAGSCYASMFQNCTSLTQAPALPATTLADSCYYAMFRKCTSLTQAPELPATTLANYCYRYMFQDCTKLNYIKAMFTTTPSSTYTSNWVSGVASTGTFVKNPNATWNVTGVNGIPSGWTVISDAE